MHQSNEASPDRRIDDLWRAQVTERLDSFDRQFAAIKANTDDIVDAFNAARGFFAVARAVGGFARWLAIIAAAVGIAYGIVKFGIGQIIADLRPK